MTYFVVDYNKYCQLSTCRILYVSMRGLLCEMLLCKAMLRFKIRTWYDDYENNGV